MHNLVTGEGVSPQQTVTSAVDRARWRQLADEWTYLIERYHRAAETRHGDGTRHSPDNACCLVLRNDRAAGADDLLAAFEPIVPHASENDRKDTAAVGRRQAA